MKAITLAFCIITFSLLFLILYLYFNPFTSNIEGFSSTGANIEMFLEEQSFYPGGKLLTIADNLFFDPDTKSMIELSNDLPGLLTIGKHNTMFREDLFISKTMIQHFNPYDKSFFSTNDNVRLLGSKTVPYTSFSSISSDFLSNEQMNIAYAEMSYKYDKTVAASRRGLPIPLGDVEVKFYGTDDLITDSDYEYLELPQPVYIHEISEKSEESEPTLYVLLSRKYNKKQIITRDDLLPDTDYNKTKRVSLIKPENDNKKLFKLVSFNNYVVLFANNVNTCCIHVIDILHFENNRRSVYNKHLKTYFIQNNNLFTVEHNKPLFENGNEYTLKSSTREKKKPKKAFPNPSSVLDSSSSNFQSTVSHNIDENYIYFAFRKENIVGQVKIVVEAQEILGKEYRSKIYIQDSSITDEEESVQEAVEEDIAQVETVEEDIAQVETVEENTTVSNPIPAPENQSRSFVSVSEYVVPQEIKSDNTNSGSKNESKNVNKLKEIIPILKTLREMEFNQYFSNYEN